MNLTKPNLPPQPFLLAGLAFGTVKACLALSLNLHCPDALDTLLNLLLLGCFGIHILLRREPVKKLALYAALVIPAFLCARRSGDMNAFLGLLACVALAGSDLDRAARWLLKCNLACFLVIVIHALIRACLYGPEGNILMVYHNGDLVVNLGYIHKNSLSLHLTSMVTLWTYTNWNRIRVPHLLVLLALALALLVLSQSKTGFVVILYALCLLAYASARRREEYAALRYAAMAAVPGIFLFTLACLLLYPNPAFYPVIQPINLLITGRIQFGVQALQEYGPTLFGHPAWYMASIQGIQVFDNVLVHGLTNIGLVWPIGYAIAFPLLAGKSREPRVHFGILLWALYAMTEFPITNGFIFFPAMLLSLLL